MSTRRPLNFDGHFPARDLVLLLYTRHAGTPTVLKNKILGVVRAAGLTAAAGLGSEGRRGGGHRAGILLVGFTRIFFMQSEPRLKIGRAILAALMQDAA